MVMMRADRGWLRFLVQGTLVRHFPEVTRAGTELRVVVENLKLSVEFFRAPLTNKMKCQTVLTAGYF